MALNSPAILLAMEALFGNIKPALDVIKRLGTMDFSDQAPTFDVKPGATIKIPVSSVAAASEYHATNNNYRTGGDTAWAELVAKHFLKGYDVTGVDIDKGINAGRIKGLFSSRAGSSIAAAALGTVASALDGTTTSTSVKCPAIGTATIDDYVNLAHGKDWLNPATSVLALKGTEMANIKKLFFGDSIAGSDQQLASYLGFKDAVVVPGLTTTRMCIVPDGALGCLARVPTYVARYLEAGSETDPDTGLSVGIVVADDQDHNRLIVNGDIWFGTAVQSCAAAATTAGIINVGTAT